MDGENPTKHRRKRRPGEKKWCGRRVGLTCEFGPWGVDTGWCPRYVRRCNNCNKPSYASRVVSKWVSIGGGRRQRVEAYLLPGGAPPGYGLAFAWDGDL